jgi:hypothetical protein
MDRGLGGPQSRCGQHGEITILDPTKTRTRTPRSSSLQLVALLTMLVRLQTTWIVSFNIYNLPLHQSNHYAITDDIVKFYFLGYNPCSPLKGNRCFRETYGLHLHGRRISQARNQRETDNNRSSDFQRTIRRYIPEDGTPHKHSCENLKSYMLTTLFKLAHFQKFYALIFWNFLQVRCSAVGMSSRLNEIISNRSVIPVWL